MHFKLRSAFFFEMTGKEIIKYLEDWAPKGIAQEKDNAGLQVGNPGHKVKNLMLSLDLSEKVIDDAIRKQCNFIFTHHPFLYHPIKRLDLSADRKARMIQKLVFNNITLYSAHTNLDFTKNGVSHQLAKRLQLKNIKPIKNLSEHQLKLIVFVPAPDLDKVAEAVHKAGGGIIGEYSHCSFRTTGTGTFKGSLQSRPTIGNRGKLETTEEVKLEIIIDEWKTNEIIRAMTEAHPYEEVAYDLIPLRNKNVNFGIGILGELAKPLESKAFLRLVATKLRTNNLRYTQGKVGKIKTVAVCGGSCGDLVDELITKNIDAFVTSDLKYHTFQEAERKILLIDAGHYETELPVLDEVQRKLKKFIGENKKIKVYKIKGSTNPVVFYNK